MGLSIVLAFNFLVGAGQMIYNQMLKRRNDRFQAKRCVPNSMKFFAALKGYVQNEFY